VLSKIVNKFLTRLELINTNVETARNDLPLIDDTVAIGNP